MVKLKIQTNTVGIIAESISEIVKLIRLWIGSADHRRMAKCIRNADRMVKLISSLEIQDKSLDKLIKKHEKYNN